MTDHTDMFCPESIGRPGAMLIITSLLLYRISAHDPILIPNMSMFRLLSRFSMPLACNTLNLPNIISSSVSDHWFLDCGYIAPPRYRCSLRMVCTTYPYSKPSN
jgi:hypothetical protein